MMPMKKGPFYVAGVREVIARCACTPPRVPPRPDEAIAETLQNQLKLRYEVGRFFDIMKVLYL